MANPRIKSEKLANSWRQSIQAANTDEVGRVMLQGNTFAFCVICGMALINKRRGTKTCGDNCRSALRERRKIVDRTVEHILFGIGDLQELITHPDPAFSDRARKALISIRNEIAAACTESGVT